ncbi:MAG: GntR family transcriptional regulator [Nevskia sp.]|nr:GntR family transcriptional regulator [Nevskia sp.]
MARTPAPAEQAASPPPANALAEQVYVAIKAEIFDFRLLPGDRFTETEIARRLGVSRTPVRDALYRLKREGYLEVAFRNGWRVQPLDFERFDELYDLRTLLETVALERLCQNELPPHIATLKAVWLVPPAERETDPRRVAELDEAFHCTLVEAAGNQEMARVHADITEKIRIIRRLDFLKRPRIETTYEEHGKILRLLQRRKATEAGILLRSHITQSRNEVRKITLHMLYQARQSVEAATPRSKPR